MLSYSRNVSKSDLAFDLQIETCRLKLKSNNGS